MKILFFLSIVSISTFALVSNADHFSVGSKIGESVALLRAEYYLPPQTALAETALDDFNISIKKEITRKREQAKRRWEEKTEAEFIEKGVNTVMGTFGTDSRCQEGRRLLGIRWDKAKNETQSIERVKDWVGYVRRRFCLALPHEDKVFSESELSRFRKEKGGYSDMSESEALAASSDS